MQLIESIDKYRQATDLFITTALGLTATDLDAPRENSWTARQVIHHVADSEAQSYARLRRLVAESGTVIQGYDEAAWGENKTLGYEELPIEIAIDVFQAVRASSLEILKRLTEKQLENSCVHSETGEYTVEKWLETYIKHPIEHAQQMKSGM